jgi:hypothetical protein
MLGTAKQQEKTNFYRGHAHGDKRKQRYKPHGVCFCNVLTLVKNLNLY